jgi:TonB family protein
MKNPKLSTILLTALATAPFYASAKTLEQAYLDGFPASASAPVPISVVAPEVGGSNATRTVTAEFVVDATGRTSAIRILSGGSDRGLDASVIDAVKEWRFRPAKEKGVPVARTVIVPFHLVRLDDPNVFVPDFVRKSRQGG